MELIKKQNMGFVFSNPEAKEIMLMTKQRRAKIKTFFPESPFQQKRIRCEQNTDSVHVPRQRNRGLVHGDENRR